MSPIRQIKKVWKHIPTIEGAGVKLNRVFGFHQVPELDPFLLLDNFGSDNRTTSGFVGDAKPEPPAARSQRRR